MSDERLIEGLLAAIARRDASFTTMQSMYRTALDLAEKRGEACARIDAMLGEAHRQIHEKDAAIKARDEVIERLKKQIDGMAAPPKIEIVPPGTCPECLGPKRAAFFTLCGPCHDSMGETAGEFCSTDMEGCDRIKGHSGPCRGVPS